MAPPFAGRRGNGGLGRSDSWKGVSSSFFGRAGDSGCPLGAEEGNAVSMRVKGACTHRRATMHLSIGDASFTRSRDPCTSIATTRSRRKPSRWRARRDIAVGQTCASRRNRHRGPVWRTARGSTRAHRFRKEGSVARQKRKEVAASVPARNRELGLVLARRNAVAEVGRRRSVPNKLTIRPPKRGTGASERGPSAERPSAVKRRRPHRANRRRESGCAVEKRCRTGEGPGWRESVIQRSYRSRKRRCGRGTGAVKATGSYEGSLSMEGIPGCTSHRLSRGGGDGSLGGSLHARSAREGVPNGRQEGEATGMSEARSQRAPWEESRPRSLRAGRRDSRFVSDCRSAEAVSGVVKRSVPRSSRAEPKLCGAPTRRKSR
jgi:hypothetical protein